MGENMERKNDSHNHPLRFEYSTKTIGQFYNSMDKQYHLAEYAPYERPPSMYLCGGIGNFSPSRSERKDRACCERCWVGFDA